MTKRLEVMGWDLMIRWSDNPHTTESADEIPEHIVRDIDRMSYPQLLNMLEILDVHDSLRKVAQDNANAKAKAQTKNK